MEALFECTLEMINKNLEEFPEHRTNFFRMLQSITTHCFSGTVYNQLITKTSHVFYALTWAHSLSLSFSIPPPHHTAPTAYLQIPPPQFKIFMDSVVWAFKHTMRNVAEIGLNILLTLLQKFAASSVAGAGFFQTYFCDLMQHIFSVVTDTSHTSSECC